MLDNIDSKVARNQRSGKLFFQFFSLYAYSIHILYIFLYTSIQISISYAFLAQSKKISRPRIGNRLEILSFGTGIISVEPSWYAVHHHSPRW